MILQSVLQPTVGGESPDQRSRYACAASFVAIFALSTPGLAADTPAMPVKAAVASADRTWSAAFETEVRWFSWNANRGFPTAASLNGGSGSQVYAPLSFQVAGKPWNDVKFEFLVRSGYVSSTQMTTDQSGAVSTPTDTTLTPTVTYYGWEILQPFTSVTLNLPTGKTVLLGTQRFARMDSDLVDIPTFGEGFNIGPTIGANIPLATSLILTLSAGYTWRGSFDKEGPADVLPQLTQRANPGDVGTVTASLGYQVGKLTTQGSIAYSHETATTLDGVSQYRAGPRYLISGVVGYGWNDNWSSSVNGNWAHSGKNDALSNGTLVPESFNSNSNVYRVSLDHTYQSGRLSLGPTFGYLYRDRNGYDSINMLFIPGKTRWSTGGVVGYAVNDFVKINGRVERIWIKESESPQKFDEFNNFIPGSAIPQVSSKGWLVSGGISFQF